ncbi:hypothetical protein R11007_01573 [Ralstonia holmesii]|nr:hypothetical protein R11007_01573 [Ralstonia sp. LMG 32967]
MRTLIKRLVIFAWNHSWIRTRTVVWAFRLFNLREA